MISTEVAGAGKVLDFSTEGDNNETTTEESMTEQEKTTGAQPPKFTGNSLWIIQIGRKALKCGVTW